MTTSKGFSLEPQVLAFARSSKVQTTGAMLSALAFFHSSMLVGGMRETMSCLYP